MSRPTQRGAPLAEAFDRAARHYDLLVSLSPGYHRQLRGSARRLVQALPGPDRAEDLVLDLGCGTGASTRALLEELGRARYAATGVCGVDASAGMIAQGQRKTWPERVSFRCADAVADLRQRADDSVGGVFAAYLVRNVPDRDELLRELARVLRPGAPLVIHEYSVAGSRRARLIWQAVCRGVIIPTAFVTDRDVQIYHYLRDSVQQFDSVPALTARLTRAGFGQVQHSTVVGWEHGIVHTLVAVAP
jgi:ubiquinone/menaquinone biosynthesis C-methylase UbiE